MIHYRKWSFSPFSSKHFRCEKILNNLSHPGKWFCKEKHTFQAACQRSIKKLCLKTVHYIHIICARCVVMQVWLCYTKWCTCFAWWAYWRGKSHWTTLEVCIGCPLLCFSFACFSAVCHTVQLILEEMSWRFPWF